MNISLRKMEERDIDRILEIEKKSFTSPWPRKSFEFEINSNLMARYIIVERAGCILGYIGLWFMVDESHVVSIAVDPEYRENGLGKMLMEAGIIESMLAGMNAMTLEVRKSNIAAKKLYEKLGFNSVGIRPKYYEDNKEDAIIMWKYFKDVEKC